MSDLDEARPDTGEATLAEFRSGRECVDEPAPSADSVPGVEGLSLGRPQQRPRVFSSERGSARLSPFPPVSVRRILEAILFATDRPVSIEQLRAAFPEREAEELERELETIAQDYEDAGRGYRLLRCAGGFQIRTDPEMHEYVTRFLVGRRRARLSRAAMETLAMIAYRQPITRGEMEEMRGVDSGQVLHTLLERGLITIRGRSQALGRPLLYATTDEFLRYFGLDSLADLPSPEELRSLLGEDPLNDPEIRGVLEAEGFGGDGADAPLPQPAEGNGGAPETSASPVADRDGAPSREANAATGEETEGPADSPVEP